MLKPASHHNEFVEIFHHATNTSEIWLHDLMKEMPFYRPKQAMAALKAVLHALRDRLIPNEALDLSAQLPTLIRGFYFDGWKLEGKPTKAKNSDQFLDLVEEYWSGGGEFDSKQITQAVFRLLSQKVSEGEIDHIKATLPKDIRALWEE